MEKPISKYKKIKGYKRKIKFVPAFRRKEDETEEQRNERLLKLLIEAREGCLKEQRKLYVLGLFRQVFVEEEEIRITEVMQQCLEEITSVTGKSDYINSGSNCCLVKPSEKQESIFTSYREWMDLEQIIERSKDEKGYKGHFASEGYRTCNDEPVDEHLKKIAAEEPELIASAILKLGKEDAQNHSLIKLFSILASTIHHAKVPSILDEETIFCLDYTRTFYDPDSKQESLKRLSEFLRRTRSRSNPDELFKEANACLDGGYGYVDSLEELEECNKIDIPGLTMLCRLAEGGSSEVYLANDKRAGHSKKVVVKLMKSGDNVGEKIKGLLERDDNKLETIFYNDINQQEELPIPGISKILGKGKYKGRIYIIQQYYKEGTLEENLSEVDFWSTGDKILKIFSQMHRERVIHRDIKPSNIFIKDSKGDVVIGDLQTCISFYSSKEEQKGYKGATHGTSHAAPECHISNRTGFSSDVYSLGLVLWRMYTGKELPFEYSTERFYKYCTPKMKITYEEADTQLDIRMSTVEKDNLDRWNEEFDRIYSEIYYELHKDYDRIAKERHEQNMEGLLGQIDNDDLRRVLSNCLAYDPDDRYKNAAELHSDFRAIKPRDYDPKEKAKEIYEEWKHDKQLIDELARMIKTT